MECCISDCDRGLQASFLKVTYCVAKKCHTCVECGCQIPAKSTYEKVDGVWDGAWDSHKVCMACVEIRDKFFCNGYVYGEIWDVLEEHVMQDILAGGECIDGLSVAAKNKMFEQKLSRMTPATGAMEMDGVSYSRTSSCWVVVGKGLIGFGWKKFDNFNAARNYIKSVMATI